MAAIVCCMCLCFSWQHLLEPIPLTELHEFDFRKKKIIHPWKESVITFMETISLSKQCPLFWQPVLPAICLAKHLPGLQ